MADNKLSVTMTKSKIGRLVSHQQCLKGLGLSRIGQTKLVQDTPENRGMIKKIQYMLKVEGV